MTRSARVGNFLARGYFQVKSPIGEVLKEKVPFTLVVSSGSVLKARSEVLEWAKFRALSLTHQNNARVELLGIRVKPRTSSNQSQLPLF